MRDKSVQFCEGAFPLKDAVSNDQLGMTLRDYFAAKAMQSLLIATNGYLTGVCEQAYIAADQMLIARDQL